MRAFARGQDVLAKVQSVDVVPDLEGGDSCFVIAQVRVAMKVRIRVVENSLPKTQEAVDVPLADVRFFSIDVNGEIEEIRNERARRRQAAISGLKNVEALDNDDLWLTDGVGEIGNDIVEL